MKTDIKEYVNQIFDRLHSMPEKAFEEYKTSKFLAEELKKCGYKVTENVGGKTGVIGVLDSNVEGPILGIRADMDALEYVIDGKKENRHACGHDAHSSMVMAVAKKMAEEGIKKGKLVIIFQPAEEIFAGAISMIESGLLDEVQELVGMHIRPVDDTQLGKASPALRHSASNIMTIQIKGLSAHGARPHLGVNVVDVVGSIIGAINSIRINPVVAHSVKVTNVSVDGNTYNCIPDKAFVALDIRAQKNYAMEELMNKINKILCNITQAYGAEYEILKINGVPAAEYDEEMIKVADESIKEVLGEEQSIGDLNNVGGDDFHYFTKRLKCKSVYIGLGADAAPGLHHKDMAFNKKALQYGVDILSKVIEKRLNLPR